MFCRVTDPVEQLSSDWVSEQAQTDLGPGLASNCHPGPIMSWRGPFDPVQCLRDFQTGQNESAKLSCTSTPQGHCWAVSKTGTIWESYENNSLEHQEKILFSQDTAVPWNRKCYLTKMINCKQTRIICWTKKYLAAKRRCKLPYADNEDVKGAGTLLPKKINQQIQKDGYWLCFDFSNRNLK